MIVVFKKDYLKELYEQGVAKKKKYRFQPQIVRRYQDRISFLIKASRVEDLFSIKSLHYEVLTGDKAGISSVRVNDQYRIEFEVETVEGESVLTLCNIIELSNHYD